MIGQGYRGRGDPSFCCAAQPPRRWAASGQTRDRGHDPARQEAPPRQIEATDQEIDALVYELYGLTEEEIEIVEEHGTNLRRTSVHERR
jgi:hypothetical protein